jgi:hypothetical protein
MRYFKELLLHKCQLTASLVERFRIFAANNFIEMSQTSPKSPSVLVKPRENSHYIDQRTSTTSPWQASYEALPFCSSDPPLRQPRSQPMHELGSPTRCSSSAKNNASASCAPSSPNSEARLLLAICLGSEVSPDSSEYAHDISLRLDDITIESQDGVIASNVRKLCGISIVDTSIQFVRYSIYLSSNNLLSNSQTDQFLR